jgi:hypothetical protein
MGLDAYGYSANEPGVRAKWWENAKMNKKTGQYVSPFPKPHEIQYWRKNQELQRWMEILWEEKGQPFPNLDANPIWGSIFNGVELELEWRDIHRLQDDIENGILDSGYYKEWDLKFCLDAKEQIFFFRKRIFYNSSW